MTWVRAGLPFLEGAPDLPERPHCGLLTGMHALTCPGRLGLLLLAALSGVSVAGANWPQFRGPQASGVDTSKASQVHALQLNARH
jgi:hypothetical protein